MSRRTRSNSIPDQVPLVLPPSFERNLRAGARAPAMSGDNNDEVDMFADANGNNEEENGSRNELGRQGAPQGDPPTNPPTNPPRNPPTNPPTNPSTSSNGASRNQTQFKNSPPTRPSNTSIAVIQEESQDRAARVKAKIEEIGTPEATGFWTEYRSTYSIMSQLQSAYNDYQANPRPWITSDKEDLLAMKHEFRELQRRIYRLFGINHPDEALEADALKMVTELEESHRKMLLAMEGMAAQPTTTPIPTASIGFKTPKTTIPKFSGIHADWLSFKDTFSQLSSTMSTLDKFRLLIEALKGQEAYDTIKDLTLSEANWKIAWSRLVDRYDSPREIAYSAIKPFMEFHPLMQQSESGLHKLIATVRTMQATLELVLKSGPTDLPISDIILGYLIQARVDGKTISDFNKSMKGNDLPSLPHILKFLEEKAKEVALNREVKSSVSSFIRRSSFEENQQRGRPEKQKMII